MLFIMPYQEWKDKKKKVILTTRVIQEKDENLLYKVIKEIIE